MTNAISRLNALGQSVWYDNIRKGLIDSGELATLVARGVSGVTSNPTIFEKAINGSSDYDDAIFAAIKAGRTLDEIYDILTLDDIARGADILRPVYDRTASLDGYISIEVPPTLAADTGATIDEARRLFAALNRPNVMIKVPATAEGIPAIRQLIADGINVNVTLIFSLDVYAEVMDAYLSGLEDRLRQGLPVSRIASVASFFVSRVDTLIDALIAQKGLDPALAGRAAVANAQLAYRLFLQTFGDSPRFAPLKQAGAQVQRPLWASTSTKNPAYPDLLYVETLVGPDTVNTMPPATVDAVLDHARPARTVDRDFAAAQAVIDALEAHGISMAAVTQQLQEEGVRAFEQSFVTLRQGLEHKRAALAATLMEVPSRTWGLTPAVTDVMRRIDRAEVVRRIWDRDESVWSADAADGHIILQALGWLDVAQTVRRQAMSLREFREEVVADGFTDAVVLGMGGSSLVSDVLRHAFADLNDGLRVHVLDTTSPEAIHALTDSLPLPTTLFIVASKSGSTTEPNAFYHYFWHVMSSVTAHPADHFVAITDPDTSMAHEAGRRGFRQIFLNPPDIGGRYSALSLFGMVPAELRGIGIAQLLEGAERMMTSCRAPAVADNPGATLGAILGGFARHGRDKVTISTPDAVDFLPDWIEQLLAESTGKRGVGLVPIAHEPPLAPASYTHDRVFVFYHWDGQPDPELEQRMQALADLGHPVVAFALRDRYALGAEFFRWEFATAVAGHVLGINPFDQPNVQESKDNTKQVLEYYLSHGSLPAETLTAVDHHLAAAVNGFSTNWGSAADVLQDLLATRKPGDYLALMAYMDPRDANRKRLQMLRAQLSRRTSLPSTLGFGPRFLHSTGQLHKGGGNNGLFIQIVGAESLRVDVADDGYDFGTLLAAQAFGDYQSLVNHGRRVVRLILSPPTEDALDYLLDKTDIEKE